MNTQQFKQHIETIAENINAITGQQVDDILPVLKRLNKQGVTLHNRFEVQCNGDHWRIGEEYALKYEKRTEHKVNLAIKTAGLIGFSEFKESHYIIMNGNDEKAMFAAICSDPRGWPIVLRVGSREHRLGVAL